MTTYTQDDLNQNGSNIVLLWGRLNKDQESTKYSVPSGKVLIITDIVIQNRAPADEPVDSSAFSRVDIGPVSNVNLTPNIDPLPPNNESDIFFTVAGNNNLNLHFETGMRVLKNFRVYNLINSTAPYIEFTISGFLTEAYIHFRPAFG